MLDSLLARSVDVTEFLAYLFPVLVERLNATDLEGIQNLPEVMRPTPSQKPHTVQHLPEASEEVRLALAELMAALLAAPPKPQNPIECFVEVKERVMNFFE